MPDITFDEFMALDDSAQTSEFDNLLAKMQPQSRWELAKNATIRGGIGLYQSLLETTSKAALAAGNADYANELRGAIDQLNKDLPNRYPLDAPQRVEDIDLSDPDSYARWAIAQGGLNAGFMGSTAAATVAGAAIAPVLGVSGAAGALAGGMLASSLLETGFTLGEARESGHEPDLASSLAAGIGKGALDSLVPAMLARRFGIGVDDATGLASKLLGSLDDSIGKGIAATTLKSMGLEGITETAQEAIDVGLRSWYDENYEFLGEDAKSRFLNAFAAGTALGGVGGAISGTFGNAPTVDTPNPAQPGAMTGNTKAFSMVGDKYSGFSYPEEPAGVFADIEKANYAQGTSLLYIPAAARDPNWVDNSDQFIAWAKQAAEKIYLDPTSTDFEVTVKADPYGNSIGYFDSVKARSGFDALINISPDERYDPRATFHHEMVHALRYLGALTKTEWGMVRAEIDQNNLIDKFQVYSRWAYSKPDYWVNNFGYSQTDADAKAADASYEEVVAEMFANYWVESRKVGYANLKDPPPSFMRQVFDKLVRFLTGDRFKLIKNQITEIKDSASLFRATLRGELKGRNIAPDQVSKKFEPGKNPPTPTVGPTSAQTAPSMTARGPGSGGYFDFRNYTPQTAQNHYIGGSFVKNLSQRGLLGAIGEKGRQWAWWYHKFVWDLRQLAHIFPDFRPLQAYREYVQLYDTKVKEWLQKADETTQTWGGLGGKRAKAIGAVLFDMRLGTYLKGVYYELKDPQGKVVREFKTKKEAEAAAGPGYTVDKVDDSRPRWPTTDEYYKLLKAAGIEADQEAIATLEAVKKNFQDVLLDIQATTIKSLEKQGLVFDWAMLNQFGVSHPEQITQDVLNAMLSFGIPLDPGLHEVAKVNELITQLQKQPYFPLSRFGKYAVIVKKGSETQYAEQFESELEATNRLKEFQKTLGPGYAITKLKVDEEFKVYQGVPPLLLDKIKATLGLSENQKAELLDLSYSYLPHQSFMHHLRTASKKPGFSRDAIRAFATYFNTVSRFLGRLEFSKDMEQAISDASPDTQAGGDQVWKSRVKDFMRWHYENRVRNPGGDWQFATSLTFLWHFFLNPSTAILNATQPALTAMPFLSKHFGTAAATGEMTRAYGQFRGIFNGKYPNLSADEQKALTIASATVIKEGLALDLAASAESASMFNLRRLTQGTKYGSFMNFLAQSGTFMFSKVEEVNRRVTYMSSLRLALKNPNHAAVMKTEQLFPQIYKKLTAQTADGGYAMSPRAARAHIFATEAVRDTMYEYALWARPRILGGPGRAILPFYNYILKSLFFIRHIPGGARYLAAMTFLAGLTGMPGAEDLLSLAKMLAPGDFDPEKYIREVLHQFDEDDKSFWPDVFLNGVTSQLPVSIGPRLGMGQIVPGMQAAASFKSGTTNFYEGLGKFGQDFGGAFFAIPLGMLNAAMAGDSVDTARKIEMASPTMVKKMMQLRRFLAEGAATGPGGERYVKFDLENPSDMAALMGQAIGFTPEKLTKFYDKRRMQVEAAGYWNGRRTGLLTQFERAYRSKDPAERAYVKARIAEYNNEAPFAPLKISTNDLITSLKARIKVDTRKERGLGPTKASQGIYRKIEELY